MPLRRPMLSALVAIAPSTAEAEKDWQFEPKSADDAIHVQANQIYPTLLTQLRLSYEHLDAGGSIVGLRSETSIPMPFVIVPGVAFADIYSIVHLDAAFATVKVPTMPRTTGIGDLHFIDAAIKYWDDIVVGAGFAMLIPSASHEVLGTGKLSIGPIAGASMRGGSLSGTIRIENLTSIAGADGRDDINLLEARTSIICYVPHAMYVSAESRFRFDWESDGETTVHLTARAGFGATKRLVFVLEPEWTVVGAGKNNVTLSVATAYVGW